MDAFCFKFLYQRHSLHSHSLNFQTVELEICHSNLVVI